jgi:Cytochrome P460
LHYNQNVISLHASWSWEDKIMRIGKTGWRAGIVILIGAAAFMAYAPPATTQSSNPPQYSNGWLLRPGGFETWVFVGSNLALAYLGSPPRQEFHNVYISPQAYEEFVRTQNFPDRTVLIIDRFTSRNRDDKGVVTAGSYNDEWLGIEVAVKNMHRPDGKTKPWAYYQFPKGGPDSAKAELDSSDFTDPKEQEQTCEGCHAVHASRDHVWVQFYPILRKLLH